ncbi:amidohydrolase 2 [Rhodopirellula maiorica SM1]|uniref:Amidohydrolase 2 n=1 Tax=Rhodopirellula maiorica SM1 TaxID=1265738 RepID=M5RRE5_9BACT|nr:amidohydrolase family protein [Rhodopirellula maiorica]EMI21908.1 amidohydrolase 2 [Rhodopirellula maiorica SM1]
MKWFLALNLLALGLCTHSLDAQQTDAIPSDSITDLQIIDCHTHFYDPSRPQGVPWPNKNSSLYRTVLPQHLRALKTERPIDGTVIVEASEWIEDNAWLLELAKDDPFIVGIVGRLDPRAADFEEQVERFAANPLFRGIRISAKLLDQMLQNETSGKLAVLAKHDLSLDVNGGLDSLAAISQLAGEMPELRIVINHVANVAITADAPPSGWVDGIKDAAQYPNVYCKISGLVEGAARGGQPVPSDLSFYRPYIDVVWNAFGEERVIYGSNWPVSERAADYAVLQKIVMQYAMQKGETATRNFFAGNAKRAYKWIERRP